EDNKEFDKHMESDVNQSPSVQSNDLSSIRILLGENPRTNKKVYWEYGHPQLENRHIQISGKSGVGKTYFMQCLLLELARNNISSIIFDYTDGFKKSKLEPEFKEYLGDRVQQFHVQLKGFPINPFKKNMKEIDEDLYKEEDNTDVAERIRSVFSAVYKGMGDQQANAIYRATMKGLEKYGSKMNLQYLRTELEADGTSNAKTVLAKIEPLIDRNPFDTESEYNWEEHRKHEGIVFVVQLSGFVREVQLIVTEFILWDLWNYNLSHGDKTKPFPVILDEAQNLDHSENSPSAKILTEGRKFGWSGWYATQFMQGQLGKDEIQRLQMASQKVYFAPPEAEVNDIASFLSTDSQKKKEWASKLSNIGKGECIVSGPMLKPDGNLERTSPMVIKVTPLNERIN
ncbi:ATP-binding protein, partial [Bacillus sp. JJ1764]|uniref:ATP-binding protein n=1 Tax=Bacillus sp. JJ1764 TaxID=3122964 RepID=UPI003000DEFD